MENGVTVRALLALMDDSEAVRIYRSYPCWYSSDTGLKRAGELRDQLDGSVLDARVCGVRRSVFGFIAIDLD